MMRDCSGLDDSSEDSSSSDGEAGPGEAGFVADVGPGPSFCCAGGLVVVRDDSLGRLSCGRGEGGLLPVLDRREPAALAE